MGVIQMFGLRTQDFWEYYSIHMAFPQPMLAIAQCNFKKICSKFGKSFFTKLDDIFLMFNTGFPHFFCSETHNEI